jgi:hypothetical protein
MSVELVLWAFMALLIGWIAAVFWALGRTGAGEARAKRRNLQRRNLR